MKAGVRYPMRQTFAGCAVAVSGTVSRLRESVTRHPTALYRMFLSSSQSSADHLLSIEAERPRFRRRRWPKRGTSVGYWRSLASDCSAWILVGTPPKGFRPPSLLHG